jgi:hypothetical protein
MVLERCLEREEDNGKISIQRTIHIYIQKEKAKVLEF